jgi:hypothetical protein
MFLKNARDANDSLETVPGSRVGTGGETMVVVPLSKSSDEAGTSSPGASAAGGRERAVDADHINWVRVAAAGSLALSGVLLMSGRKRAGLVAAVSGTALAMLDQQDSLKAWWATLPYYLDDVQLMLSRAQGAVDNISVQHEKLHSMFTK